MTLYINSTDVSAITEVIDEASMSVISAYNDNGATIIEHRDNDLSPDQVAESLDQFIDILLMVEVDQANAMMFHQTATQLEDSILQSEVKPLDADELSLIGNHGLGLLQTLSDWAFTLHLPEVHHKIQFVMVAVSLWVARHGGKLDELESVVTTITALANATNDSDVLIELSNAAGELIDATSDEIRNSRFGHKQNKSWKVLNICRGIIATRSHHVETMKTVFEELVLNLPEDSIIFFEEGLQQMDSLDYPDHVKQVMTTFFHDHGMRVLH